MFRIAVTLVSAAVVLAACASSQSGTSDSSDSRSTSQKTASQQVVAQGFVDAVTLYCLPAIEHSKRLSELSSEVQNASRIEIAPESRSEDDSDDWVIAGSGANVVLRHSEDECYVSAYGVPVAPIYDIVAVSVTHPGAGFTEKTDFPPTKSPLVIFRGFHKQTDQGELRITLSGNEQGAPGTMSRFSTLTASVNLVPDAPKETK